MAAVQDEAAEKVRWVVVILIPARVVGMVAVWARVHKTPVPTANASVPIAARPFRTNEGCHVLMSTVPSVAAK